MGKALIGEVCGTFCLVFFGCGAIVANGVSNGAITHVGIALTFGIVIMSMIYAFGEISGAHFNPAVTIAMIFAGKMKADKGAAYIVAQLIGAFAASAALLMAFGNVENLGTTLPRGSEMQSFALEAVLTAVLVLVALCVSTGSKEIGVMAGIAIGGVIALEALSMGPITGASMNPARSIAPAVVSGMLKSLWVYIAGPIVGGLVAVPIFKLMRSSTPSSH